MIYYMNTSLEPSCHFWRPVPESFTVEHAHKENLQFKIGETIYPTYSEAFAQAVTWDKLKG